MDSSSSNYNHLFFHNMTSSIKLHFSMVKDIKPWLILQLLGEEFVSAEIDEVLFYNEVGNVQFGKTSGKLYEDDGNFYLRFEDGRTFNLCV